MTTKQQNSSSVPVTTASNSASRQAAQILYRMANSAGSGAGTSLVTEPITPVLLAGPTMLQPSPAHFTISNFNQAGGSGIQQTHNIIPFYIQQAPGQQMKQDGTAMTFQIQPQQFQMLQQQPQQQGRAVFQLNMGDQQQFQMARMPNGMGAGVQQHVGKGRAGGRKPNAKDEKLSSEELDRRRVRRERNKQAAARCRKRRMDQTNVLTEETDGLEEAQNKLKADIEKYQHEISEIQFILEAHRNSCPKDIPVTTVQTSVPHPPRARSAVPAPVPQVVSIASDAISMPPPPAISVAAPPVSVPSVVEAIVVTAPTDEPSKKRPSGSAATRPNLLPLKSDQQLDSLAMPTPNPSKLVFNFESHSGLTPTGSTPTGLTPLIPSCYTDVQDKDADQPRSSSDSAAETSPVDRTSL